MLSIIIPTKNEEQYLPRTLRSIKRQTFKDYEIIIADSNSLDNTREIAKSYGCKVVEGGLPARGRNQGAKQSKGEILVFADSDIIFPRNFLEKAVLEIKKRDLDISGTLQTPILSGNFFRDIEYKAFYCLSNFGLKITEKTQSPCMQVCMFVKRSVHEELGGFNENLAFGEDSEYSKRAKRAGFKFRILNIRSKILVSPRRLRKGGLNILAKYLYLNTRRMFGAEFKKNGKVRYFK